MTTAQVPLKSTAVSTSTSAATANLVKAAGDRDEDVALKIIETIAPLILKNANTPTDDAEATVLGRLIAKAAEPIYAWVKE